MKKSFRLTKNIEFKGVYKTGRRWSGPFFTMYIKKNNMMHSRFGVSISKKVGKSVVRNKIKRRIKAIIRTNIDYIIRGYDVVFSVRPLAKKLNYLEMEKEIKTLMRRGRIYSAKKVNNSNDTVL